MELQVNRWGNSLALRLPNKILKQMHLQEGSKVQVELSDDGRLVVQPSPQASALASREQIITELQAMHKDWPMGRSVIRFMRDGGY